jgi:hypothetical protein
MVQLLGMLIMAVAAIAALYVLARPHWAFVLLMVMFPLKQLLQVYVPFIGNNPTLVNYAIGSIVLAAVGVRLARRDGVGSQYLNRITIMTLAIYALWLIGIFFSPARDSIVERLHIDLLYQILFLVLMPLLIVDLVEFRRALFGLMVAGTIISLLIMFNPHSSYYAGRLTLDMSMLATSRDATGNALATASLGAMTALVAVLIRPERASPLIFWLRVVAFIAGMGIAIGSGSRGQVLAACIAAIIFYPLSRRLANPRQFVVAVIGFAVLSIGIYAVFKLFIGAQNQERWNPLGMLRDTTTRLDMVMLLFNEWLSKPSQWVFGLGTGFYSSISPDRTVARSYVHNVVAEILCEHGLVAFTLFMLIVFTLLKYARRMIAMFRDEPSLRSCVAILCAISLFSLLEALKQGSISYPAPFFWWMIFAKLALHEMRQAEHAPVLAADVDEYDAQGAGAYHEPEGGHDRELEGYALPSS